MQMKKIQNLLIPAIFFITTLIPHFSINSLWGKNTNSPNQAVTTSYIDLPANQEIVLKSLLDTSDLKSLTEKNLQLMGRYLAKHVTHNKSQFGTNVTSNYFWFIYNALPEFVDKSERHQGYYENQNSQNQADRLLAYAIYRIDRNPENLKRLFNYGKPFIKTVIDKQDYIHNGLKKKVDCLLEIHSKLTKIENYREKMLEASSRADMIRGKTPSDEDFSDFIKSAYGFSAYDLSELIFLKLGMDANENYDYFYNCFTEWSFWMRRICEGNMDAVHSILVEISQMYD